MPATGSRLLSVTDYINGIQYIGNMIDFIRTAEGSATNSAGTYKYEFTLTHHLGNNRVSFDETNGKVQETDYYAFGLNVNKQTYFANKYLYNKKELRRNLVSTIIARFYDTVIGRFASVDPLVNMMRYLLYSYVMNKPIRFNNTDEINGLYIQSRIDRCR